MEKIIILGPCGAGKSTLACELAELLSLPVIHLDQVYWQPGWIESTSEDFVARLAKHLEGATWIVDGNYTSHLSPRFEAADTIIHLDYPRWLHFSRILKRVVTSYGQVRPDMAEGCPEQFDWEFLKFCWRFRRDNTPKVRSQIDRVQGTKKILEFKRPKELNLWLKTLGQ